MKNLRPKKDLSILLYHSVG